jgi:hypothetical protein
VKSHPHLLVRDSLAARFVAACDGDREAREQLANLDRWAQGAGPASGLCDILAETGEPLFHAEGLTSEFAALEPWVRDRAQRYAAACTWIDEEHSTGNTIACARAAWDAGLFFEVHELLEPVWLAAAGETKHLLQAMIMAGAGFHHLTEGNLAGAQGLLRQSATRLRGIEHDTFDFDTFGRALGQIARDIEAGTVRGPEQVATPPRLERV